MTTLPERILSGEVEAPDILCGGTPCQTFSVAGNRQSLDDHRGNLTLTFCEIANAIDTARLVHGQQPAIILWENVPGVLNTKDNAFGCFLAALTGEDEPLEPTGEKWANAGYVLGPKRAIAWRILDAQYFGVAQRRRRVFVVASAREGFCPAEILFEQEGLLRDSAPRQSKGQQTASGDIGSHVVSFGIQGNIIGRQPHNGPNGIGFSKEIAPTLTKTDRHGVVGTLTTRTGNANDNYSAEVGHLVIDKTGHPRWLTPIECERLMGFPDNYTNIPYKNKPATDSPRYKALGNSWAAPVIHWIAKRIIFTHQ